MKCHYPDVFCAALLNSQPMGFYAPAQIVRDAQEHGVEVRPVDVNFSDWDCTLEPCGADRFAVRLGLRQVAGLREESAAQIMRNRDTPYRDIADLQKRAGIGAAHVRRLAEADAMRSMFIDRRQALWEAKGLRDAPDLPLFRDGADEGREVTVPLPVMPVCEQGGVGLPDHAAVAEGSSTCLLRTSMRKQGLWDSRQLKVQPDFPEDQDPRAGAGTATARQRQGRLFHHDRGRARGCEPCRLAQGNGAIPQDGDAIAASAGGRLRTARRRDHPCRRPASGGPVRGAVAACARRLCTAAFAGRPRGQPAAITIQPPPARCACHS